MTNTIFSKFILIVFSISTLICFPGCGDGGGGGGEEVLPGESTNQAPTASFIILNAPDEVCANNKINFDASKSSDPDNKITTYLWTFKTDDKIEIEKTTVEPLFSADVSDSTKLVLITLVVTDELGKSSYPIISKELNLECSTDGGGGVGGGGGTLTAIFVSSTNGSDESTNNGSATTPAKTINHGLELAVQNNLTTVYVFEGTYSEQVELKSGIKLIGGVQSVNDDNTINFALNGSSTTIIEAPAETTSAVDAENIASATIENFKIAGSTNTAATSIFIKGSDQINIRWVNIKTPGKADGFCRDINIESGSNIAIDHSTFENSGLCKQYYGVYAVDSYNLSVVSDREDGDTNRFIIHPGSESSVTAVSASNTDNMNVVGAIIKNSTSGEKISDNTLFTGISIGDAANSTVGDNLIDVAGGTQPVGILFGCTNIAIKATAVKNTISITNAFSTDATGISTNCNLTGGGATITIKQNYILVAPVDGKVLSVRGISLSSSSWPITVLAANNVIYMPPVSNNDQANKSGVYLTRVGAASVVSIYNNTMIISGKTGELNGIYSDSIPDRTTRSILKPSTINNVIEVAGINQYNSFFKLRFACSTLGCTENTRTNLMTKRAPISYIYYFDSNPKVLMPVPATPDANGNFAENITLSSFSSLNGALLTDFLDYAQNKGTALSDVTVDYNNKPRDGQPDIGAIEY